MGTQAQTSEGSLGVRKKQRNDLRVGRGSRGTLRAVEWKFGLREETGFAVQQSVIRISVRQSTDVRMATMITMIAAIVRVYRITSMVIDVFDRSVGVERIRLGKVGGTLNPHQEKGQSD